MADGVSFQIKGLDKLLSEFRDLDRKTQNQALRKAGSPIANRLRNRMRAGAPKRTGKGAKAIQYSVSARAGNVTIKVGPAGKRKYLGKSETGTRRMRAQPFMQPALDAETADVVREFAEGIEEQIRSVARG
jgi:HK97 gp10 family phage protein